MGSHEEYRQRLLNRMSSCYWYRTRGSELTGETWHLHTVGTLDLGDDTVGSRLSSDESGNEAD